MTDTSRPLQPIAIDQVEKFDYRVRAAALRLMAEKIIDGPPHLYGFALNDVLASDHLREVLDCLAAMAIGGFAEYYAGNVAVDWESAEHAINREIQIAEDLAAGPPWEDDRGD
jgi:hypothetical protein